jgi:hypothetical protein
LALQELSQLGIPEMVQVYTDELIHLHQGQGIELFWRDTLTCPSEEEYVDMVNNSKFWGATRKCVYIDLFINRNKWFITFGGTFNASCQ